MICAGHLGAFDLARIKGGERASKWGSMYDCLTMLKGLANPDGP